MEAAQSTNPQTPDVRYILITQCLQNDFFLNEDCRLCLPMGAVTAMLVGKHAAAEYKVEGGRRVFTKAHVEKGPLKQLLRALRKDRAAPLHIVNIRDWHVAGGSYDAERREYGPHCAAGTWGADFVDGVASELDPTRDDVARNPYFHQVGNTFIYHVRSDSIFDFKSRTLLADYPELALEELLDVLLMGSRDVVDQLHARLRDRNTTIAELGAARGTARPQAYVAAIGAYTDIKIRLLLGGIRTRYQLPNLIVSDTFTASLTLERQIEALDYAEKVLDVEVVHGLKELVHFLGGDPSSLESDATLAASRGFREYASFLRDKQGVLTFQDGTLRSYLDATEAGARKNARFIDFANKFLLVFGMLLLAATPLTALLGKQIGLTALTGGLGLAQVLAVFAWKPMNNLQRNVTNWAIFRMVLETHSLKIALSRYHLTTARVLCEISHARGPGGTIADAEAASAQIRVLTESLAAIEKIDAADFAILQSLGLDIGAVGAEKTTSRRNAGGKDPKSAKGATVATDADAVPHGPTAQHAGAHPARNGARSPKKGAVADG